MTTPAGWFPDPNDGTRLRYWDGTQWTEDSRSTSTPPPPGATTTPPSSAGVPWWQSWPAIIIGFLLCFIPGLVALWMRRGTSTKAKILVTAAAAILLVLGIAVTPSASDEGEPAADPTPTPSPTQSSASPSTSASPSPTPIEPARVAVVAVVGMNVDKAKKKLKAAGLAVNVVRKPSAQPTGRVLNQRPNGGTKTAPRSPVTLVVAARFPRVANVLGDNQKTATKTLRNAGFKVSTHTRQSSAKPGTVIEQSPMPGTLMPPGSKVSLTIAKKPPPPPTTQPSNCTPGYSPCLPPAPDYDCAGGTGDGPKYTGPVTVTGSDPYDLDSDNNGYGCETS